MTTSAGEVPPTTTPSEGPPKGIGVAQPPDQMRAGTDPKTVEGFKANWNARAEEGRKLLKPSDNSSEKDDGGTEGADLSNIDVSGADHEGAGEASEPGKTILTINGIPVSGRRSINERGEIVFTPDDPELIKQAEATDVVESNPGVEDKGADYDPLVRDENRRVEEKSDLNKQYEYLKDDLTRMKHAHLPGESFGEYQTWAYESFVRENADLLNPKLLVEMDDPLIWQAFQRFAKGEAGIDKIRRQAPVAAKAERLSEADGEGVKAKSSEKPAEDVDPVVDGAGEDAEAEKAEAERRKAAADGGAQDGDKDKKDGEGSGDKTDDKVTAGPGDTPGLLTGEDSDNPPIVDDKQATSQTASQPSSTTERQRMGLKQRVKGWLNRARGWFRRGRSDQVAQQGEPKQPGAPRDTSKPNFGQFDDSSYGERGPGDEHMSEADLMRRRLAREGAGEKPASPKIVKTKIGNTEYWHKEGEEPYALKAKQNASGGSPDIGNPATEAVLGEESSRDPATDDEAKWYTESMDSLSDEYFKLALKAQEGKRGTSANILATYEEELYKTELQLRGKDINDDIRRELEATKDRLIRENVAHYGKPWRVGEEMRLRAMDVDQLQSISSVDDPILFDVAKLELKLRDENVNEATREEYRKQIDEQIHRISYDVRTRRVREQIDLALGKQPSGRVEDSSGDAVDGSGVVAEESTFTPEQIDEAKRNAVFTIVYSSDQSELAEWIDSDNPLMKDLVESGQAIHAQLNENPDMQIVEENLQRMVAALTDASDADLQTVWDAHMAFLGRKDAESATPENKAHPTLDEATQQILQAQAASEDETSRAA